ncbi:hypothetical protein H257_03624 [Aphanomyces astaci]|uniref:Major facilitator superfamily (MFS) profile domain-containing protein n=1 Tax=Aphanomyces astaci TaxID=112090 RepID=W4GYK0_APHAT|nr:hypothetical protein H257_03624 [Aphanomyces astaci]ETV84406.1 hypothetical protein H257_03624 [Aphanomyces astaci]|eukprot:XP_009826098.1 hypothetical protein H257_03624 [Aphanomyces astaci]
MTTLPLKSAVIGSPATAAVLAPVEVLYLISFLDLFSVSLIVPSLPSYVKSLGGDAVSIGYISSLYGAIQMVSAPLAGVLSDIFDRRLVLLVGIAGSAVGYAILGFSMTLSMVVFSRVPCGVFKHTLSTVRLAVADQTLPNARADALGKINAYSSFGFIFGPLVGGILGAYPNGFNYTAMLTAVVFCCNYVLVLLYVPPAKPKVVASREILCDDPTDIDPMLLDTDRDAPEVAHDIRSIARAVLDKLSDYKDILALSPIARNLLSVRLLMAAAAILFRSHFMLLLEEKYNASSTTRGYVLSYMGGLAASSGLVVGRLVAWVQSETLLVQGASVVYVLTFLSIAMSTSLPMVLALQAPQVVAISVLRACSVSLQTASVAPESLGGIMGVSDSLTALARTAGPLLSGYLYVMSSAGPAYGATALATVSCVLFYATMVRTHAPHAPIVALHRNHDE